MKFAMIVLIILYSLAGCTIIFVSQHERILNIQDEED